MEVTAGPGGAEWVDVMNLVARHWRAVGVDMQVKSIDRSLHTTRTSANEHDAMVWNGEGGLQDAILEPRSYFPFSDGSDFAMAWAAWYNPAGVPGRRRRSRRRPRSRWSSTTGSGRRGTRGSRKP